MTALAMKVMIKRNADAFYRIAGDLVRGGALAVGSRSATSSGPMPSEVSVRRAWLSLRMKATKGKQGLVSFHCMIACTPIR
jgi:hypothetical protein